MIIPENALQLPGWTITGISEGARRLDFTAAPPPPLCNPCPNCHATTDIVRHGNRTCRLVDAPIRGKHVTIHVHQSRYRCRSCNKSFTPVICGLANAIPLTDSELLGEWRRRIKAEEKRKAEGIEFPPGHVWKPLRRRHQLLMTKRCANYISVAALQRPFAWVAEDVGVDEKTIRQISSYYELQKKYQPKPSWKYKYIGIDDVWLGKKTRTIVVDLETGWPIEILEGFTIEHVRDFIASIDNKDIIEVVCMDMAAHFSSAITLDLPNAIIVYDKWHVQRQALDAVDRARINLQFHIVNVDKDDEINHEAAKQISLTMRKHRTLFHRRRFYNFAPGLEERLKKYLSDYPTLMVAYWLKEQFLDIWRATDYKDAEFRIQMWVADLKFESDKYVQYIESLNIAPNSKEVMYVADRSDPATLFKKVHNNLTTYPEFILNYFRTKIPITNAMTEAVNGNIKTVQRIGRGYKFTTLRDRIIGKEYRDYKSKKRNIPTRDVTKDEWFRKLRKVCINDYILLDDGRRFGKCMASSCKNRLDFTSRETPDANGYLYVRASYIYCSDCYEAKVEHFSNPWGQKNSGRRQKEMNFASDKIK